MIDPTITIGNLLTIAGFFITFGLAWAKFDKRIALLEAAIATIEKYIENSAEQAETDREDLQELRMTIARIR